MKAKKLMVIICTCVLFLMSTIPVLASTQESREWYEMKEEDFEVSDQGQDGDAIIPRSLYIVNVVTRLQNLGSGKLGLRAEVYCASKVNSIKTTFYLQKLVNGSWKDVSSGTASTSNSNSMIKNMSVSGVTAGTYRAKTYTVVSYGGYSETATGFSGSMTIS